MTRTQVQFFELAEMGLEIVLLYDDQAGSLAGSRSSLGIGSHATAARASVLHGAVHH